MPACCTPNGPPLGNQSQACWKKWCNNVVQVKNWVVSDKASELLKGYSCWNIIFWQVTHSWWKRCWWARYLWTRQWGRYWWTMAFIALGVALTTETSPGMTLPVPTTFNGKGRVSSWWLNQPIWKISIKLDHFPRLRGETSKNIWVGAT